MHKYEAIVLNILKSGKVLTLDELVNKSGLERDKLAWAIENLSSRNAVDVEKQEAETIELSEEGKSYVKSKMPEEALLEAAKNGSIKVGSLSNKEEQIGMQWAKKKNLIILNNGIIELNSEGKAALSKGVEDGNVLRLLSKSPEKYSELMKSNKESVLNLIKRGLISTKKKNEIKGVIITGKGLKEISGESNLDQIDALNKNIIMNKSWSGKEFKPYDVTLDVEKEQIAMRHPVRNTIRKIMDTYVSLGFKQVSGPIIEPAFWVFDSLFVPQDHPARDVQDTFYLSNPEKISLAKEESVERIKKAHTDSWGGEWKTEVAEQALLRTHTTNISVRNINNILSGALKKKGKFEFPIKLFSVGRVFRNENIDYRHLTDFYQHDGIVIGNNLTFANLFDILISIYKPFGLELKFKPAYFPFVEPGVEFYVYSEKTKELIEMGGAGIIRKEITGVPRKNITVLAWGPGLERTLLVKDPEIKSITELYNNDVGWLRKRRMV
jgi:phenylalanyl-tRNA synthetase alpha chain